MKRNPCLNCTKKNHNKNNPICRNCDKRIDYVNRLEITLNGTFCYSESRSASIAAPISFLSRGSLLDV